MLAENEEIRLADVLISVEAPPEHRKLPGFAQKVDLGRTGAPAHWSEPAMRSSWKHQAGNRMTSERHPERKTHREGHDRITRADGDIRVDFQVGVDVPLRAVVEEQVATPEHVGVDVRRELLAQELVQLAAVKTFDTECTGRIGRRRSGC